MRSMCVHTLLHTKYCLWRFTGKASHGTFSREDEDEGLTVNPFGPLELFFNYVHALST